MPVTIGADQRLSCCTDCCCHQTAADLTCCCAIIKLSLMQAADDVGQKELSLMQSRSRGQNAACTWYSVRVYLTTEG